MNFEVFCFVGLLRFPEQLEPSLALLPKEQRTEAMKLLAALKELPKPELLRKWASLRREQYAEMSRKTREATGIRLDAVSPALREWCVSWLADQHG